MKDRIMIVEDEVLIGMSLRAELETGGFEVCALVGSGEGAVASASETHPDIILMDVNLKGNMDGIEAARRIRNRARPAFIFLTGYEDQGLQERLEEVRPAGVLRKPVRLIDLLALIGSIRTPGPGHPTG